MSANSTPKGRSRKACWLVAGFHIKRPYADFPLTPHASGTWMKKIRGSFFYFGHWAKRVNGKLKRVPNDGWEEALKVYEAQADDLHAGRTPRVQSGELTVMDLCNRFLTEKKHRLDAGKLSARMFDEYRATTDRLLSTFGKTRRVSDLAADNFSALLVALEKQYGPVRCGNEVQKVRTVFKFAYEEELIEHPMRYGSQFKKPSAGVMRRHRAKSGERMLEADQLRTLIEAAPAAVKAMLFLGLNAGYGNHDIATLPLSALDLDNGWVNYAQSENRHIPSLSSVAGDCHSPPRGHRRQTRTSARGSCRAGVRHDARPALACQRYRQSRLRGGDVT